MCLLIIAIVYFKNEEGRDKEAGNIKNAVPFLHQDPDSDEILGQCEESRRDLRACDIVCVIDGGILSDGL